MLAALASGCGADLRPAIEVQPFEIVASDGSPTWSPDGSFIAYTHYYPPSAPEIRIVDPAGVAPHQILRGTWEYLDWSPDGTHLAISRPSGIYSVRTAGDSLRAITSTGSTPRWSPSGDEIAFQTIDSTGVGTIWLVSRDGTRLRSLTPPGTESWNDPDWSPDGARLVHVRRPSTSGPWDVFVMDTTGHAEQRLTTVSGQYYGPAWSPDGQWIAWSSGSFPPSNELWIMKADGTEGHMLTYGGDPSWAPDSRRIVYTKLVFNVVRLYTIDIVSLDIREITH